MNSAVVFFAGSTAKQDHEIKHGQIDTDEDDPVIQAVVGPNDGRQEKEGHGEHHQGHGEFYRRRFPPDQGQGAGTGLLIAFHVLKILDQFPDQGEAKGQGGHDPGGFHIPKGGADIDKGQTEHEGYYDIADEGQGLEFVTVGNEQRRCQQGGDIEGHEVDQGGTEDADGKEIEHIDAGSGNFHFP